MSVFMLRELRNLQSASPVSPPIVNRLPSLGLQDQLMCRKRRMKQRVWASDVDVSQFDQVCCVRSSIDRRNSTLTNEARQGCRCRASFICKIGGFWGSRGDVNQSPREARSVLAGVRVGFLRLDNQSHSLCATYLRRGDLPEFYLGVRAH